MNYDEYGDKLVEYARKSRDKILSLNERLMYRNMFNNLINEGFDDET